VSANSVGKWRDRCRVRRLDGLVDEPRPGVARKVTDEVFVDIITRTLEALPPHTTQWTTRSMADIVGVSKATISRIWRTVGLQSHRIDTFKLSAASPHLSKRCAISWGCTSTRPTTHSCSVSTKRAKCRR